MPKSLNTQFYAYIKLMKVLMSLQLTKDSGALIELRVSQINGCLYCCNLHLIDARKNNVSQETLDLLPIWFSSKEALSEKEVIALRWCEAITLGSFEKVDEMKDELLQRFSEREIVDITSCISI